MGSLQVAVLLTVFGQACCLLSINNYFVIWSDVENTDQHGPSQIYTGRSLVAKSRLKRDAARTENEARITSLHVVSRVASRFAETLISSELENTKSSDVEAQFLVQIPEAAFISNFSMVIDGVAYVPEVLSKEDAQKKYNDAVEANKTAGQVAQSPRTPAEAERGFELFTVSVNVKAESRVSFELEYQQLLQRKYGVYENRISVRPNQVVADLRVDVYIYEPQGISQLDVIEPTLSNSLENQDTVIHDISDAIKEVTYQPSAERQRLLDTTAGVLGDLVITYDVNHSDDVGLLQRAEEYFVHFFSPNENNLQALGKNIVFVIDISGSMSGRKIEQTRNAMLTILDQLHPDDRFLLLLFDDQVQYWPSGKEMVTVTDDSIQRAKAYAQEKLEARGSTGINAALVKACDVISELRSVRGKDMVVFLTDGLPTYGETDPSKIIRNVESACAESVAIFSLGFGFDVNFELLQSLAYRTKGFAKRIYEGVDAATQLEDFFKEISTPLIYDIGVSYPDAAVDTSSLTATTFAQYFHGSELVIAGKIANPAITEWDVVVTGETDGVYEMSNTVDMTVLVVPPQASRAASTSFIEKLYIYLKIKDLLKETLIALDADEKAEKRAYALQLALQYRLVTPLTSLIIVEQEPQLEEEWMEDTGNVRFHATPKIKDTAASVPPSGRANDAGGGAGGLGLSLQWTSLLALCLAVVLVTI